MFTNVYVTILCQLSAGGTVNEVKNCKISLGIQMQMLTNF